MAITTPDQRLRVFVSSTLKELAAERVAARVAIEGLHLTPVLFELGARPHPPRDLYLAYIRQSHVFLAIYAEQYGWIAPGQQVSGLEDEYVAAGDKPKLVYLREPAPERDPRLAALLDRVRSDGLSYRTFHDPAELGSLVADDLAVLLSERFGVDAPPLAARWRLPAPPTRLVGRERELNLLHDLFSDPAVRLVTLTGPGGIGKTRLALEAAHRARQHFRGRVAAAFLAAVTSAELVLPAIATALRVPEAFGRSPLEVLDHLLQAEATLLVLDNFEHVIDAAPDVAALLRDAPLLTVLVTSRAVLHLSAEHVVDVGELPAPEAAELFWDRARAARADLQADDASRRAVAAIARHLDGLPLAIELAAARARLLDPAVIAQRLQEGVGDLLPGAPRDLPERQRTLRQTVQWSYDLLDRRDRLLFERLGVFTSGFALDAAEAVCADHLVPDMLDRLASLVDNSLINVHPAAAQHPRFTILNMIREFALERLEAAGELEARRWSHARFFSDLTVAAGSGFRMGARHLVEAFALDQANIATAMRWLLDHEEAADVARMGFALWPLWWVRGRFVEGMGWMAELLDGPFLLPDHQRADAFFVLGMLAFGHGDHERAAPALRTARESYEQLGEVPGAATAAVPLAVITALAHREHGQTQLEEAVSTFRELDDSWGLTFALFNMGGVLLLRERFAAAVPLLTESVERARALGTDVLLSHALIHLGWAYVELRNLSAATAALREALRRAAQVEDREAIGRALEALAALAAVDGQPDHGALLFGAAEGIRRSVGADVWRSDRASHARTESLLRGALGGDAYRTTTATGAALTADEALALIH